MKTPSQVLHTLKQGNLTFCSVKKTPYQENDSNSFSKNIQEPIAVIIGCSDSRVSPEIIFNAALGELFVIRTAGNVITPTGMESIVFGSIDLNAPLIVVMGHQNCGAIDAVLAKKITNIPQTAAKIDEALKAYGHSIGTLDVKQAIIDNILYSVNTVAKHPLIAKAQSAGQIQVVGAYFNFETCKIEFLKT
ncbi:hypothetical protein COB21_03415 [Candidatus Aerophobetes bacterium]|uniref:carbonic anhydrase n=1 Tax=Aerophobetes bacterium TaxID=2030807 RepID=A0A2A4X586_UNCAE|nr:MAG: hypothetical protein COB21_03415 [Candidatus Aerophobetes bacterium]